MSTSNTLPIIKDQVRLVLIENPFEPSARTMVDVAWKPGNVIADFIPKTFTEPMVSASSGVFSTPEEMQATPVAQGEVLHITQIPLGGGDGGGKSFMRMAAFIALSVYAGPAASAILPGAGVAATGFMQAGIMLAGSYLINSVLPVPKVSTEDEEDSNSYAITGPKNTSREGLPVPMTYGKLRTGGNVVSIAVENETTKSQLVNLMIVAGEAPISDITDVFINDQPIENYGDWSWAAKLDGRAEFNPANWDVIKSSDPDSPEPTPGSPEANRLAPKNIGSLNYVNKNVALTTAWSIHETIGTVDTLRLDLTAPGGLWSVNDKGKLLAKTVPIEMQVAPIDDPNNWSPVWADILSLNDIAFVYRGDDGSDEDTYYQLNPPTVTATWNANNENDVKAYGVEVGGWGEGGALTDDQAIVYLKYGNKFDAEFDTPQYTERWGRKFRGRVGTDQLMLVGKTRSTLRFSIVSGALPEARYRLRYRRTTEEASTDSTTSYDAITVNDVVEIESERVGFKSTAMLAVQCRLSDQLSSMPKVTYVNHGRLIKAWEGDLGTGQWVTKAADNPAWVSWDILTSDRGAGQDESRLEFAAWYRWAKFCTDNQLPFNGIFDTASNLWDSLQTVFRVGRAQIIPTGTKYTVAIEKPDTYSMVFGNGNIIEGTFSSSWLPVAERANEVEITYFDKDDDYRQNTVKVAEKNVYDGQKQRLSTISMPGVTTARQATEEAWLHLNMNKFVRRSASFETTLEAVGVMPGDVVLVQNNHPQWGYSGRTEAGSTATAIVIDSEVPTALGYEMLVHSPSTVLSTGTILDVGPGYIQVSLNSAIDADTPSMRLNAASKEYPVHSLDGSHPNYFIPIADTSGLSVATSITLYAGDTFVKRTVSDVTDNGDTTFTVTLASALPFIPERGVNWLFGQTDLAGKPYRVTSVEMGSNPYQRKLNLLEYDENAYADEYTDAIPKKYGHIPNYITHVNALSTGDSYEETGVGVSVATAMVGWKKPDVGVYEGADIYVSQNNGPFELVGSTRAGATTYSYKNCETGDDLTFRVVAYDTSQRRAPYSSAPTSSIYLDGVDTALLLQDISISTPEVNTINIRWAGLDYEGYAEIYRGTVNVFSEARRIDKGRGGGYIDYVEANVTYYYWVRFGGISGIVFGDPEGPFEATAFGYDDIEVDWDDITGEGFDANQRMNDATIPAGVHVGGFGNLRFRSSNSPYAGMIVVGGDTFYHPDGTKRNFGSNSDRWLLTPWYDANTINVFFLMWSDEAVASRFSGWNYFVAGEIREPNLMPVTYDQRADVWTAHDANGNTFTFSPRTTDCIVGRGFKVADYGGLDAVTSFIGASEGLPEDYATNSKTYRQPDAPLDGSGKDVLREGDLWIDTDDDNRLYRWSGFQWIEVADLRIIQALDEIADAVLATDGKIELYFQAQPPTNPQENDLWYDTSDGNKPYIYQSGQWVDAQDADIAQAVDAADLAQATADGKITTFFTDSKNSWEWPSPEAVGDLLYVRPLSVVYRTSNGLTWDTTGDPYINELEMPTSSNMLLDPGFDNYVIRGKETWDVDGANIPVGAFLSVGFHGEGGSPGLRIYCEAGNGSHASMSANKFYPCSRGKVLRVGMRYSTVSVRAQAILKLYDKDKNFIDSISLVFPSSTLYDYQMRYLYVDIDSLETDYSAVAFIQADFGGLYVDSAGYLNVDYVSLEEVEGHRLIYRGWETTPNIVPTGVHTGTNLGIGHRIFSNDDSVTVGYSGIYQGNDASDVAALRIVAVKDGSIVKSQQIHSSMLVGSEAIVMSGSATFTNLSFGNYSFAIAHWGTSGITVREANLAVEIRRASRSLIA